jgi:hypothetical protein
VSLTPESMDGEAGALSQSLHLRVLAGAACVLRERSAVVIDGHSDHDELRACFRRRVRWGRKGLVRIGALVEVAGQERTHGALASQTITLTAPIKPDFASS